MTDLLDMIMNENENLNYNSYQMIENLEVMMSMLFKDTEVNEIHISKFEKCKLDLAYYISLIILGIEDNITEEKEALLAELRGLAVHGSITRYQITDMIQYLQDRMMSGELDSSLMFESQHGSMVPGNNPELETSHVVKAENYFFDPVEEQGTTQNQSLNSSDFNESNFFIEGDFRLDTSQSVVDLESELNKVDIMSMKLDKIVLLFDKIAVNSKN